MRLAMVTVGVLVSGSAWAICPLADAFATGTGLIAQGSTVGLPSDYTTTCGGGGGSPDFQVEYTATQAGRYTFDTVGSSYDTVLSAISTTDCLTSLACNDDFTGLQSQISVDLTAGQVVLLNVDGFSSGSSGDFVLNAAWAPPPVCAYDFLLGSATGAAVASGDTCGATADFDGASCGGGQGSPDVAYGWTAPASGTYVIDTETSSYDTALTVRSTSCTELACDDDSGSGLLSSISFQATAGQQVFIVVDGFSSASCGPYVLNINAGGGCPDADGDGICDAQDLCTGDDATGDSDRDGTCDDRDFMLSLRDPIPGQQLTLGATRAEPSSRVYFLVSTTGPGSGPCHPTAGICVDIRGPLTVLGSVRATAQGNATLNINVPATVPSGTRAAFQAVYIGSGTDKTQVAARTVQ